MRGARGLVDRRRHPSKCGIWTGNPDGSNPTRLTFTKEAQETWPTWSPDGSAIAYTSNASDSFRDIWVVDANGGNQTAFTVTGDVFDVFLGWQPA